MCCTYSLIVLWQFNAEITSEYSGPQTGIHEHGEQSKILDIRSSLKFLLSRYGTHGKEGMT